MNREVNLNMLLEDGIIQPGEGVLCLDIQGTTYTCDLLENGNVFWNGKTFTSALDWLTQLKLTYNLAKSFPVWTNIRYNGIKLNQYKHMYMKKMSKMSDQFMEFTLQPSQSGEVRLVPEPELFSGELEEKPLQLGEKRQQAACSDNEEEPEEKSDKEGDCSPPVKAPSYSRPLSSSSSSSSSSGGKRKKSSEGSSAPVAYLTNQFQPQLLECAVFSMLAIDQPYKISFNKSAILLMNYHCHVTTTEEVSGYLAGDYRREDSTIVIKRCFPCCCELSDGEQGQRCEEKIHNDIQQSGMMVIGWYHSHPDFSPRPTYQDVVLQKKYQNTVKMALDEEPCVAFIVNSKTKLKKDGSNFYHQSCCFWVKSLDQSSGVPMLMEYTVNEDDVSSISRHIEEVTQYYSKTGKAVDRDSIWSYCLSSLPAKETPCDLPLSNPSSPPSSPPS